MTRKQKLLKFFITTIIVILALDYILTNFSMFLIIALAGMIVTMVIYFRQTPFKLNTVVCLTGAPGSGKTKTGTSLAIKAYRRQNLRYKLNKLLRGVPSWYFPKWAHKPHIYSNIPICIGKKKGKPVFCEVLKKSHLLMTERLPEYCVVFIDEIGSIASQWDYDNPYVQTNLQIFVRFFRHFIGTERGGLIMTEQSSDFIAKVVRDRCGMIINMTECRRAWRVLPILRTDYCEMLSVEGTSTIVTEDARDLPYIAVFTPYRWMPQGRRVYESRCYKYLYQNKAQKEISSFDEYYTRYLIDLSADKADRKLYATDKKRYMENYLYEADAQPKTKIR